MTCLGQLLRKGLIYRPVCRVQQGNTQEFTYCFIIYFWHSEKHFWIALVIVQNSWQILFWNIFLLMTNSALFRFKGNNLKKYSFRCLWTHLYGNFLFLLCRSQNMIILCKLVYRQMSFDCWLIPGHSNALQLIDWPSWRARPPLPSDNKQKAPPVLGGGLLHLRVRKRTPVPQVLEHAV